jgi:hypothetical protein
MALEAEVSLPTMPVVRQFHARAREGSIVSRSLLRSDFNTACELGFRGSLDEWNRLMGAVARR